ncbi:MAG: ATP-binding protein [Okeania sp. SIO3I5]|uniref:AAA-like domain-containing protein n=1 Tax=Okeania sp. SIO3I5 TaxID=2607805 RepID=UPI0013B943B5|nr:ATP-binding protein [Okeania sp. SIO3I5]NEQ39859.1 ATP-binding protein [Okeania sp. SIO3I5]
MSNSQFISNPYIIGRPIREKDKFYGRREIFYFIENQLKQNSQVILLQGQRRIGKTSVLEQVSNFVDLDNFVFIQLSLQDKNFINIGGLFEVLAIDIKDYITITLEIEENSISCNNNSEEQDILNWFEKIFLPEVYGTLGGKNVVLMLDEFDSLDNIDQDTEKKFYTYLNQIVKRDKKLFLLPVIGKPVEDLSQHFQNSFRQVASEKIGLLKTADAEKLITNPTEKLKYQDEAIKKILKLSANHPYFTQVLCFALFNNAIARDIWEVTFQDVESIVEKAISNCQLGLVSLRDSLPIYEKVVFFAVAKSQDIDGLTEQLGILENYGVSVTDAFKKALKNLEEWDFLEKQSSSSLQDFYQLKVEFVRRWLIENDFLKILGEAIRKLEIADIEANALYEEVGKIGESDINSKIEKYKEIINKNTNHFRAKFELAKLYHDTRIFDLAIELYENIDKLYQKVDRFREYENIDQFLPLKVENNLREARWQYISVLLAETDNLESLKSAEQQLKEIFKLEQNNKEVITKLGEVNRKIRYLTGNPFTIGKPVEPEDFVGRGDIINNTFNQIQQNSNCLFDGSSGIGKSSLLRYLVEPASWDIRKYNIDINDYYVLEIDCESIENLSVTSFWQEVLRELDEKTADDTKLNDNLQKVLAQETITQVEIESLLKLISDEKPLVLLMDNYHALFKQKNNYSSDEASKLLRQLKSINYRRHIKCSMVMTSSEKIEKLLQELKEDTSICEYIVSFSLEPFNNNEMRELWERMPEQWRDRKELYGQAKYLTGGYPGLFQIFCYYLWSLCRENIDQQTWNKRYEELYDRFYEQAKLMLNEIWKSLTQAEQGMLLLVILSDLEGRVKNVRKYDLSGIRESLREKDHVLNSLKIRKIITKTGTDINHKDIYDLTSFAFKKWVINEIIIKGVDQDVTQREKIFLFVKQKDVSMVRKLFDELWKSKDTIIKRLLSPLPPIDININHRTENIQSKN